MIAHPWEPTTVVERPAFTPEHRSWGYICVCAIHQALRQILEVQKDWSLFVFLKCTYVTYSNAWANWIQLWRTQLCILLLCQKYRNYIYLQVTRHLQIRTTTSTQQQILYILTRTNILPKISRKTVITIFRENYQPQPLTDQTLLQNERKSP